MLWMAVGYDGFIAGWALFGGDAWRYHWLFAEERR